MNAVRCPAPDWGHWGYGEEHLPATFHETTGPGSLSHVMSWLKGNPLALFDDQPAGYCRVEKTLLVLGLTLRELERVLFTDEENSQNYPAHIQNSKLTIADWDKVRVGCQELLNSVHIQDEETPKSDGGVNAKAGDSASMVGGKEKKRVIR